MVAMRNAQMTDLRFRLHSPRSHTSRWAARWSTPPRRVSSAAPSCRTWPSLCPVSSAPDRLRWWGRSPRIPLRAHLGRRRGCRRWAARRWFRCWRPTLREDVLAEKCVNECGDCSGEWDLALHDRQGEWWGAFKQLLFKAQRRRRSRRRSERCKKWEALS